MRDKLGRFVKGSKKSQNAHSFVKGHKHSDKTKKKIGISNSISLLGHKVSKETKEKISQLYMGENNPNWKGDNAKYVAIHQWVSNNFGKTIKCEKCDSIKNIDWSNKNHKYSRNRDDWQQLCKKCHKKYDMELLK